MERHMINPWGWQDKLGFAQAHHLTGAQQVLICAGQASMRAQVSQALDNLETVLARAGFTLSDVVRLNYYTTDVDRFFEAYEIVLDRLARADCQPAATLLGVTRLAFAPLLVEIEATAVA